MTDGLNRRDWMATMGIGALALTVGSAAGRALGAEAREAPPYELVKLPYECNALEPTLQEQIVRIHHDKHQAGYVKGLNATLAALEKARESGSMADVRRLSRDLAFNGSGDILHILYWNSMKPGEPAEPTGALKATLERDFGSVEKFKTQFAAASKAVEGSGWGLLVFEPMGKRLLCLQAQNHEGLAIWGCVPLLCCDVWEHAYYLQYQNRRADYVDAFMKIIDWPGVAKRHEACIS